MSLVIVEYSDLVSTKSDLSQSLSDAYGEGSLGVIGIRNVPGFEPAKLDVLLQGHSIAHLPSETLKSLEDPASLFNSGWSHGKEKLGDKPDFAKGSYYFNPLSDSPGTQQDRENYPVSYPRNIWPKDIPEFEPAAKKLGCLMHGVTAELARHIDTFAVNNVPGYCADLGFAMKNTEKAKGRLLYYFPLSEEAVAENKPDSWIGWHNDSGFLTALAGDIYVDDATGQVVSCPDPEAGLYVANRDGSEIKVNIPSDCLAIQLGECVQIMTAGKLVATPHCVKGAKNSKIARISHPVFIDTVPQYKLRIPSGTTREEVIKRTVNSKVPTLADRFTHDGMEFGEFLKVTFEKYYQWQTK